MGFFSDFDIQIQSDELVSINNSELEGQISFEEFEKENLKKTEK